MADKTVQQRRYEARCEAEKSRRKEAEARAKRTLLPLSALDRLTTTSDHYRIRFARTNEWERPDQLTAEFTAHLSEAFNEEQGADACLTYARARLARDQPRLWTLYQLWRTERLRWHDIGRRMGVHRTTAARLGREAQRLLDQFYDECQERRPQSSRAS